MSDLTGVLPLEHTAVDSRGTRRYEAPIRSHRFFIVAAASVATHFVLLIIFSLHFKFPRPVAPALEAIPVTLIDFPPGGLAGAAGGNPRANNSTRTPVRVVMHPAVAPKRMPHLHAHPIEARRIEEHALDAKSEPKTDNAQNTPQVIRLREAGSSAASTASMTEGQQADVSDSGSASGVGGGSGAGIGMGSGTGTGGGFGNGRKGPSAIYAPLPSIPEDLRDEVMQANAVARFKVSRDGKVAVALLQHTDFSELDDIILDTLRRWRFLPAMNHGLAVDSEADVRLRITVK